MPEPEPGPVVVIGAGIAGATAALTLRAEGYEGELVLVGDEPEPPYRRPPLSKEVLSGAQPPSRTLLRPVASWAERGIDLRTGVAATSLDTDRRRVLLSDGTTLPYRRLLLATGGRPGRLPAADALPGVHRLRSLDDANALRSALTGGGRVLIIGAGLIGLEVAATARGLGCEVTVTEADERPLARVLPALVADAVAALHRSRGVELLTGLRLDRFERRDGRIAAAPRESGPGSSSTLTADTVVVAVGMTPETALAERAGLKTDDGILVDAFGETSAPGVYAAGDVARGPFGSGGAPRRFEHWAHAQEHGAAVARNMLGAGVPYSPRPWFWTHQYGSSLQVAGDPRDAGTLTVDGDPEAFDFTVRAWRDGRLTAAVCANRPAEFRALRAELEADGMRVPSVAAVEGVT
ncbi:NAD(P)/FAD-dependent oxidoreductase [Streptomyces sp. V3I7]|uniref:NAD(P)/FAD-dependent oxidoreductase n=1 Tax=Streptomyces sp. V3I7 TaxID=3042278 RepID=UPI0027809BA4|nr:FAD-dependent oxidoreductase [Streptomyces sp. V3I7]MDQ0994635.1 3-phenylpropionate/trans-cinnamate dioxygenase ferredoxin reductase subunit [Streptomyces sp. V3I7]